MNFDRARIVMEGFFGEIYSPEKVDEEKFILYVHEVNAIGHEGYKAHKAFFELWRNTNGDYNSQILYQRWKNEIFAWAYKAYAKNNVLFIEHGVWDVLEGRSDVLIKQ